jgi:hypothetical protein
MKIFYKLFLISIFIFDVNYAQSLKKSDFNIGLLKLDESINLIIKNYGKPYKELIEEDDIYYYPNFTIWLNNMDNKINAFLIIHADKTLLIKLTIGDSLKKILGLYGKPGNSGNKFDRFVGGYDYKFKDYSSYLDYSFKTNKFDSHFGEYIYWHIIFYIKKDIIVRILYFEEIFE